MFCSLCHNTRKDRQRVLLVGIFVEPDVTVNKRFHIAVLQFSNKA